MWLPTPIYERIPQFWFLIGLLFVAGGLYLGIDYTVSLAYLAIGIVSCAKGIGIAIIRMRYRRNQATGDDSESPTH
jgi:hypothetical protein